MTDVLAPARPPILTVLVTTRDRWSVLTAQTGALHNLLTELCAAFEIIVHDAAVLTAPRPSIEALPPSVRYVHAPDTMDALEDAVYQTFGHCRGEYVWLLADDDSVEPAGLRALLEIIDRGNEDLIVFNSRLGLDDRLNDEGAYIAQRCQSVFYGDEIHCSIATFVQKTGLFDGPCNISTVCVRRSSAPIAPLEVYRSISRTHAYIAWLIEVGKDKHFVFVNRPLVVHGRPRVDQQDGSHLRSEGLRESSFSNAAQMGLRLRILDAMLARGALSIYQIRLISNISDGTRSDFGSDLASQVLEQIGESPEIMPSDDIALVARWLIRLFPGSIFLNALVNDIALFSARHGASLLRIEQDSRYDQATRVMAGDLRARAAWWRQAILRTAWYTRHYVETFHLYDIYDFGERWVAARIGVEGLSQALEVIDLPSVPPVFLCAPTCEALRDLVKSQPLEPEALAAVCAAASRPNPWGQPKPVPQAAMKHASPTSFAQGEPQLHDDPTLRLRTELSRQDDQLAEIHASASWRLTGWLRRLAGFIRPLKVRTELVSPPTLELETQLDLGRPEADAFLPRGFSASEGWGRWTDGRTATFRCRHRARDLAGFLEVWPTMLWDRGSSDAFIVNVSINEGTRTPIAVRAGEPFHVPIPARVMASPNLEVAFHIAAPKRHAEAPVDDMRGLGMGLAGLRLSFVGSAFERTT